MPIIEIRESDMIAYVKRALGENFIPTAGYTYWDTYRALMNGRKSEQLPPIMVKAIKLTLDNKPHFNRDGMRIRNRPSMLRSGREIKTVVLLGK